MIREEQLVTFLSSITYSIIFLNRKQNIWVFFLSTMHSTCLLCPGYLSNCVIVVQRLRSRLHTNHRWLILVSCQTAIATAWTVNKTEKTLFLFNTVAKMLLVNFTIEQDQAVRTKGKALELQILLLWDKRATWHRQLLCFQAALCTRARIINGSCAISSPLFAALLYFHVPQFHGIHQGDKNTPKKSTHYIWTKNFKKL